VAVWNSLPDYVVMVDSTVLFKKRLDNFWSYQDVYFNFEADLEVEVISYIINNVLRCEQGGFCLCPSTTIPSSIGGSRGAQGACAPPLKVPGKKIVCSFFIMQN